MNDEWRLNFLLASICMYRALGISSASTVFGLSLRLSNFLFKTNSNQGTREIELSLPAGWSSSFQVWPELWSQKTQRTWHISQVSQVKLHPAFQLFPWCIASHFLLLICGHVGRWVLNLIMDGRSNVFCPYFIRDLIINFILALMIADSFVSGGFSEAPFGNLSRACVGIWCWTKVTRNVDSFTKNVCYLLSAAKTQALKLAAIGPRLNYMFLIH